jgi:hypothetical protein
VDIYPAPLDIVLGLDRPRPLGPVLSGFWCILTQDLGYEFPRIHLLGSSVNSRILPLPLAKPTLAARPGLA